MISVGAVVIGSNNNKNNNKNNINMEKLLYYNGKRIDYSYNLVDNILKLSLKKGDTFKLLPFNYFNDEKTDMKGDFLEYHTHVKITDIKITMIQSWNLEIRNKIEIFLENNNQY